MFQYRKRYEVTCDRLKARTAYSLFFKFQYRKRYEVTCDMDMDSVKEISVQVSIPQAV